jgi:ubiquitin carboxyl-terminal hydrolase 7
VGGVEGELNKLVEGTVTNYIKCSNVDYESLRDETFNFIQLQVQDMQDIYQSLDHYTTTEKLTGDNKYFAG